MENRYKLTYDLKQKLLETVTFKQGDIDSSVLEISLLNESIPEIITGETIEFRFMKADGTAVYQNSSAGVTVLDELNGVVECVLKSNTLAIPGIVICEIHREKDGIELTTLSFGFMVEKSIIGDVVLSTNYISSINSLLIDINNAEDIRMSQFTENEAAREAIFNKMVHTDPAFEIIELGNKVDEIGTQLTDIFQDVAMFGAKGDYNTITKLGTDDTASFQNAINDLSSSITRNKCGTILIGNFNYYFNGIVTIPSNITILGNHANIYIGDTGRFVMQKNAVNITVKGIFFHGSLKYTKITNLDVNKITVENAVFKIGDILGISNYSEFDKPYAKVVAFDSNKTYTLKRASVPGGEYNLDTCISSFNGAMLNGDYGAVIGTFDWNALLCGDTNNNILIEDCFFDSARGYAMLFPRTSNILINRCRITNNGLDMLLFSADGNVPVVSNITVKDTIFDTHIDYGKQAIVPVIDNTDDGAIIKNLIIDGCSFNKISESACSFGYSTGKLKNVKITNNVFTNTMLDSICIGGEDIIISGNNSKLNGSNGTFRIGGYESTWYSASSKIKNIKISNNTIEGANGIIVQYASVAGDSAGIIPEDITIESNYITADYIGIGLNGVKIKVMENTITVPVPSPYREGSSSVIFPYGSDNVQITNNIFNGCAFVLWNGKSTNLLIEQNVFNPYGYAGVTRLNLFSYDATPSNSIIIKDNTINESGGFELICNAETGHDIEYLGNKLIRADKSIFDIPRVKQNPARFNSAESIANGGYWISNIDNHYIQKTLISTLYSGYALPVDGVFKIGDIVVNLSPIEEGTPGNKYVVYGWQCYIAPKTFFALRSLTGN